MMELDSIHINDDGRVDLRFVTDDGLFFREARAPGQSIADLPAAARAEIEEVWTPQFVTDFLAAVEAETQPEPPVAADVDAERDRRISAGFTFNGIRFQSRSDDRENIAGASTAALAAMMAGAQPGDLRWHGGDTDFAWIAEDNSLMPMDAQTMFAFGQAAMAHKQALIFAARALKDMAMIPADFADDSYWPAA